jgi:ferredoxin
LDIYGSATVRLSKLGSQALTTRYRKDSKTGEEYMVQFKDSLSPEIEMAEGVVSEALWGTNVRIPYAKAYDVCSQYMETKFTLIDSDGEIIYDETAVGYEYSFKAEKYGTYIFIGDMVTDIDPNLLGAIEPMSIRRCEGCGACKRACPTGILRGEGCDCLSAITQRKGELCDEEKALMRKYNTLWGCDECQTSCPHNFNPPVTPIEFFHKDRIPSLTFEILDSMSDEEFNKRAFAWRKRATVERNLEILYGEK